MNHGLFAPQFGLLRRPDLHTQPADTASTNAAAHTHADADADADAAAFFAPTGPTIVVRRRRLIGPGGAAGEGRPEGAEAASGPAMKTPKIYRLQPPTTAAAAATSSAPTAQTGAEAADTAPSTVMPRRRPRNALRAPTLLSHTVFAPPERNSEPAAAPADVVPPADDTSSYEAVCLALAGVRDALDAARRARRFGLQLAPNQQP